MGVIFVTRSEPPILTRIVKILISFFFFFGLKCWIQWLTKKGRSYLQRLKFEDCTGSLRFTPLNSSATYVTRKRIPEEESNSYFISERVLVIMFVEFEKPNSVTCCGDENSKVGSSPFIENSATLKILTSTSGFSFNKRWDIHETPRNSKILSDVHSEVVLER